MQKNFAQIVYNIRQSKLFSITIVRVLPILSTTSIYRESLHCAWVYYKDPRAKENNQDTFHPLKACEYQISHDSHHISLVIIFALLLMISGRAYKHYPSPLR